MLFLWELHMSLIIRAPNGCTQFVPGTGGNIQSYNFQGGNQLSAQDYSICLRQEEGIEILL